jgi:hypothetical protein
LGNFLALGNIIGVLYTVVIANVCSLAIMAWCIRRSSISIVAIYVSARPGFIVLINAMSYNGDFWLISFFTFLVAIGLITASISKKNEKKERDQEINDKKQNELQ